MGNGPDEDVPGEAQSPDAVRSAEVIDTEKIGKFRITLQKELGQFVLVVIVEDGREWEREIDDKVSFLNGVRLALETNDQGDAERAFSAATKNTRAADPPDPAAHFAAIRFMLSNEEIGVSEVEIL